MTEQPNTQHKTTLKEFGLAFVDTFKRKPLTTIAKLAVVVAIVAIAILLVVYFAPVIPIAATIGIGAIYLLSSAMFSTFLFRDIKNSLFASFKKNHALDGIENQKVVLVLEAKTDYNGAFQFDQRDIFNKVNKKYSVVFETISDIYDVAAIIDRALENNNNIKAIWFRAHGEPQGMQLDDDNCITMENIYLLKKHFKKINPKGYIILDSCSTGGVNDNGENNIAQKIAGLAKGRIVIASSDTTNPFSIQVGEKNPLDVKMWAVHKSSKNCILKYPSIALNALKMYIFGITKGRGIFKSFAFDATQVYRYNIT